jgi:hypothetical protein
VHSLPALSLPESAVEAYGSIRAALESRGEMIGNNHLRIAAHAVVAGLTLVTNNKRISASAWAEGPELGCLANLHDRLAPKHASSLDNKRQANLTTEVGDCMCIMVM